MNLTIIGKNPLILFILIAAFSIILHHIYTMGTSMSVLRIKRLFHRKHTNDSGAGDDDVQLMSAEQTEGQQSNSTKRIWMFKKRRRVTTKSNVSRTFPYSCQEHQLVDIGELEEIHND